MPEYKLGQDLGGYEQRTLKKAIIIFAIAEALVLIPIIVYTLLR